MGFWKIVGGIAAGVGAVALLPVAGAVGAVTLTGAVVGGTVGAVVAAGSDDEDEKKRLRAENERTAASCAAATSKARKAVEESAQKVETAQRKAKQAEQRAAEAEKSLREAADTLERYRESLKDVESHYQLVIALTAIGMAAANADGHVDECETSEMDEYISGIAASKLPAKVKARIQYLHNHPPTFEKAAAEIAKLDKKGLPIAVFRQLILDVVNADGVVEDSEKAFLQKWDDMIDNGIVPVKAVAKAKPAPRAKAAKSAVNKSVAVKKTKKPTASKSSSNRVGGKRTCVKACVRKSRV